MQALDALLRRSTPTAAHDSHECNFDKPKCDDDTRVGIIGEIMERLRDRTDKRMVCLTGSAGSGKSAIAQSICQQTKLEGSLAGSFFFSSRDPERDHARSFIPTLACQIAEKSPAAKRQILREVDNYPTIFDKAIDTQLDTLLINPLQAAANLLPHVIVIDGLDECKSEDERGLVLSALHKLQRADNINMRVFLTSRPEHPIREALSPSGTFHAEAYHLVLNEYDATQDITGYLRRQLGRIGQDMGQPDWISDETLKQLVADSDGLWIYASTLVKFLAERRGLSHGKRLTLVLDRTSTGMASRATIDSLYYTIVTSAQTRYEAALGQQHNCVESDFMTRLFSVHWARGFAGATVRAVKEGLTTYGVDLEAFLSWEEGDLKRVFEDLHSVVQIQGQPRAFFVTPYHKSFDDYLDRRFADGGLTLQRGIKAYICTQLLTTLGNILSGDPGRSSIAFDRV